MTNQVKFQKNDEMNTSDNTVKNDQHDAYSSDACDIFEEGVCREKE